MLDAGILQGFDDNVATSSEGDALADGLGAGLEPVEDLQGAFVIGR